MTELLAATPNFRRRILAAGEMRELGAASPELHREAGQFRRQTGKIRLDHRRCLAMPLGS